MGGEGGFGGEKKRGASAGNADHPRFRTRVPAAFGRAEKRASKKGERAPLFLL